VSETPKTPAGFATERIMLDVKRRLGWESGWESGSESLTTHQSNQVYDAVLSELEKILPKPRSTHQLWADEADDR